MRRVLIFILLLFNILLFFLFIYFFDIYTIFFNFQKIKIGMKKIEVIKIMGEPNNVINIDDKILFEYKGCWNYPIIIFDLNYSVIEKYIYD